MNSEDYIKYLDQELTDEERSRVKALLDSNPEAKKELDAVIAMRQYAKKKSSELNAIQASQDIYQTYKDKSIPKQQNANKGILRWLVPLAVAAMVLFGIFGLGLFDTSTPSNQVLYATFFTPAELSLTVRSAGNQQLQKQAETSFNNKEYAQASEELSNLLTQNADNKKASFYKALSDIELEKYEEARQALSALSNDKAYRGEALYFLGLSYLKENNILESISILSSIEQGSFRYNTAQQLLEELRKD